MWESVSENTVKKTTPQEERLGLNSDKGKPNLMQEEKLITVLYTNTSTQHKYGDNNVYMKYQARGDQEDETQVGREKTRAKDSYMKVKSTEANTSLTARLKNQIPQS